MSGDVRRSIERSDLKAQKAGSGPVELRRAVHASSGGAAKAEAGRWIAEVNEDEKIGAPRRGERLLAPMPAWYEFLCGPVTLWQEEIMRAFLAEVIPFADAQAREASRLFNAVGRKRSHRVDALIAATAIVAGARLATGNESDFAPFLAHGLQLV
jgi:predicted nucleic acid-binding protein